MGALVFHINELFAMFSTTVVEIVVKPVDSSLRYYKQNSLYWFYSLMNFPAGQKILKLEHKTVK